ncbi:hypothetical protein LXL04_008562 [Taraxacum kok-saghyz]
MGRLSIHKIKFAFFCFSKSNDAAYCKNILFFTFDVWRLYQINRRLITQALSWTAGDCWRWRNPYGFSVVCLCHCYVLLEVCSDNLQVSTALCNFLGLFSRLYRHT